MVVALGVFVRRPMSLPTGLRSRKSSGVPATGTMSPVGTRAESDGVYLEAWSVTS